jgi:hypothetical protein
MTVSELYTAVALLGFEEKIDEEATFYPALYTALHTISRIVPQTKRAVLAHYPPTALVTDREITLFSGGASSYQAEGAKSFYIELSGKGKITLIGKNGDEIAVFGVNGTDTWDSPNEYEVKRGFLRDINNDFPAVAGIKIEAETMCRIKCIALYDEIISHETIDIPSPKQTAYNLSRIFSDFRELYAPPKMIINGKSVMIDGYNIQGDILYLSSDLNGDIEIEYLPKITQYTADNENDNLDIPSDYIGALKLLIASYVWLDDSESKAQYYKALYNEEISLVAKYRRDLNPVKCESVNNW